MELVSTVCIVLSGLLFLAWISGFFLTSLGDIQYYLIMGAILLFMTSLVLDEEQPEQKDTTNKPEPHQVITP